MKSTRWFRTWLGLLALLIAAGAWSYARQLSEGLAITGLSRDITWGLYIAQFTFMVGVAASAVMVVLPYYLHDQKVFGRITILGEMLAIAAVTMCGMFIMVDMGQPARVLNVLLYPSPSSLMFWDMVSLGGYLVLNVVIAGTALRAERRDTAAPRWLRALAIVSIPWAISIHTVTAFLYSGLPGRAFWLTAILAPRFLASAFACGPALLILLCLLLRKVSAFDAGREAIQKLAVIMTYAVVISLFLVFVELFTVFYGQRPEEMGPFRQLGPVTWMAAALAVVAALLLVVPRARQNERLLGAAAAMVFVAFWMEKGIALVVAGFVPSPLGAVARYVPTLPETSIALGIWAAGALVLTLLLRTVLRVRGDLVQAVQLPPVSPVGPLPGKF